MDSALFTRLSAVTPEEQAILDGSATIDRRLYMDGGGNTVNAQKLLSAGELITLRPHTRFIHFPEHTHDYVEVVYMCAGETEHLVNGNPVRLRRGELLFMHQSATHEICKSGREDVAVNFIILPAFFSGILAAMGGEQTPLRQFLLDCLCGQASGAGFLHFRVEGIVPVQNLVENLLFTLLEQGPDTRRTSELTMVLLFWQLMARTERLVPPAGEEGLAFQVLSYIEVHYADGSLTELARLLHYDLYSLSREIRRRTGRTYTELVQQKRLAQAAFLLENTERNIDVIANAVGYANIGYFHRLFRQTFGLSPHAYRLQMR